MLYSTGLDSSILLYSDGYKRAADLLLHRLAGLELTVESERQVRSLPRRIPGMDRRLLSRFETFPNIKCYIGEGGRLLFDLVNSAMDADVFVIGPNQRLIPKLMTYYHDRARKIVIVVLNRGKTPDYRGLPVDATRVHIVGARVDDARSIRRACEAIVGIPRTSGSTR